MENVLRIIGLEGTDFGHVILVQFFKEYCVKHFVKLESSSFPSLTLHIIFKFECVYRNISTIRFTYFATEKKTQ